MPALVVPRATKVIQELKVTLVKKGLMVMVLKVIQVLQAPKATPERRVLPEHPATKAIKAIQVTKETKVTDSILPTHILIQTTLHLLVTSFLLIQVQVRLILLYHHLHHKAIG